MFTQVITPIENHIILQIPNEFLRHKVKVTVDNIDKKSKANFTSVEEALKYFTAVKIDTSWVYLRS
jgi:cysteine sulfinate desulfinase/cysteine desulfurase-like protein